ncbi:GAF domain-containing protein [Haloarcula litorea]|uniref:GAF domain-containing protein n=1 Tax=Haloarcula litorea TaxID=3032579 RepID=UPI0023E7664A|nr:GAF domain-containing protein [Halomicroarcula sp. GDY20]
MSADSPTVVYADPDETGRETTAAALTDASLQVVTTPTVAETERALAERPDCVVTAATFPDGDAADVVTAVRDAEPDCPCVVYAAESPADLPRGGPGQVVEYVPRTVPNAAERLAEIVAAAASEPTQAAYPVPADEAERLAALRQYDVESLSAAETFDRLTALIASHFDIDVAFVGLVDEHEERFVACEGANWRTLAREDTICTHTILTEEVMVVEDTHEDPRFDGNERLDELDIRSYAGARITDGEGRALGAVCCTDDEPRSYTRAERDDLRRFADEVAEQLQLRRRLDGGAG